MKKLWLLVAGIAIVSCKNEAPKDYAIITGNISNADTKEMTLYGTTDRSFKKHTIAIQEDGSFIDTVRVDGQYFLYQAKNGTPLHLEAGDHIRIKYDSKDFDNTLAMSGNGFEISAYLVAKKQKERALMGKGTEVYTKEEADYKKTFQSIKAAQKELLQATSGIDADYKTKEERNIQYAYLGKLSNYKSYHAHYAKKKDFEPSKDFLNELDALQYDNEEDFAFSIAYKTLVTNHYRKKATDVADKDDLYASLSMLRTCASIENQTIKNALLHEASVNNITYAEDLEKFYVEYKAAGSTDDKNNAIIEKKYKDLKKLAKGNASPKFVNYENYKGGTTSLDDLKGKYVYIDVWATWCGPCKRQIPFLKEVEKKYHGKNIEFLSISIDQKKDHKAWKEMVKDKELGGIQLFADSDWKSQFIQDYMIQGIPKFILLDPQGNIVSANAPTPSNKKLIALFQDLKI